MNALALVREMERNEEYIRALKEAISRSGCEENMEFGWEWPASTLMNMVYEFEDRNKAIERLLESTSVKEG